MIDVDIETNSELFFVDRSKLEKEGVGEKKVKSYKSRVTNRTSFFLIIIIKSQRFHYIILKIIDNKLELDEEK